MMKIFIAIWKDRHTDTTAHPFYNQEEAVDWARGKAKVYAEHAGGSEDYEETDCANIDGWVFYATYSCEGDCIYVVEAEIR